MQAPVFVDALMVLKTLDVLGLHGYHIAPRIEQISGEMLALYRAAEARAGGRHRIGVETVGKQPPGVCATQITGSRKTRVGHTAAIIARLFEVKAKELAWES
jgi:hypothetical protein